MSQALEDCKKALQIKSNVFDEQIQLLVDACKMDLEIAGVNPSAIVETDALIRRAIVTYATLNFGTPFEESSSRKSGFSNLKASYDEQKAQLLMNHNYRVY